MSIDGELYERCPLCRGSGIAIDPGNAGFTTRCRGCDGEKYRQAGINMHAIEQMIIDAREAHRFYRADGSALHIESADEVRYLRIEVAKRLQALEEESRRLDTV